jgi:hypothetical protein
MSHLLRRAAASGNLAKLRERVETGDDVESRDKGTGRTPLLEAVIANRFEAARYLLEMGAKTDASCMAVGYDALGWAAEQGHVDLIGLLLEKDADPNRVPKNSFMGRTPLMNAAQSGHLNAVKMLLEAGADASRRDNCGETALHLARRAGHAAVADFLAITAGSDPAPLPEPEATDWPPVAWEQPRPLYDAGEAIPIPDNAMPAQIARGYIVAMHRWEANACRADKEAGMKGDSFDMRAALQEADKIRDAYATGKKRVYGNASYGCPPQYELGLAMIGEDYPGKSRCEITTRNLDAKPGDFSHHEILFVLLRKKGKWRIDSVKERLVGEQKWISMIL